LFNHLVWRFRNAEAGVSSPVVDPSTSPCVFRPRHAPLLAPSPPAGVNEQIKSLLLAQFWIESKSGQRTIGVEMIADLLRTPLRASDWSRGHYGALAVQACIADGAFDTARKILDLALQFAPQDARLRYLSRVLTRAPAGVQLTGLQ
jgi:hypothetical protein